MSWLDVYKQQADYWDMAAQYPGLRSKGVTEKFCKDAADTYRALAKEAEDV